MSKWIAEFDLEDGDSMPEHMDLNYMGAKIDFHCKPMWIPVSEKLPEEHGEYLVTDKYGRVTSGLWIGNAKRWKDVIAWMPLPEPYKAEREDKK